MWLITFVAALAIVCAPADAQSQPSSQELTQAIQAGSISAMMVAGESGDSRYIPYLLEINKDKKRNWNERTSAQLALAKLGQQ